jgi:hypothetical protein
VRFRELNPPRYECALIGIQQQGVNLDWLPGDYTVNPDALRDPWLANTGFGAGDTIQGVVSVESDTIPDNQSAAASCAHPRTIFFHRERGSDKDGNADAIRYVDPSGARVFASGSHQFSWALDGFRVESLPGINTGNDVPADPRVQKFMANALDDLTRPAPPSRLTAGSSPAGVSLDATLLADPRVTGVRIVRYLSGSTEAVPVCETVDGTCLDRPPGHRSYTYAAVAEDPWGISAPTQSASIAVPDSPPVLLLRGPRLVRAGSAHLYTVVVRDRDGDRPTLRWHLDGTLEPGGGVQRLVSFPHAGRFRIEVQASDGYGGVARTVSEVVAR